jgi:hypothetical protein
VIRGSSGGWYTKEGRRKARKKERKEEGSKNMHFWRIAFWIRGYGGQGCLEFVGRPLDHHHFVILTCRPWIIRGWVGIPTAVSFIVGGDVAFERFCVCIGCRIQKAGRKEGRKLGGRLNNILIQNE